MPLSSDPDARFPFWLKCDAEKPADVRPTFIGRYLTRRQVQKLLRLEEQASALIGAGKIDEGNALRDQSIAVGLVGWKNITDPEGQPVDFAIVTSAEGERTIPALDDILTHNEKVELLTAMYAAAHASEQDLKNSRSPLLSA